MPKKYHRTTILTDPDVATKLQDLALSLGYKRVLHGRTVGNVSGMVRDIALGRLQLMVTMVEVDQQEEHRETAQRQE